MAAGISLNRSRQVPAEDTPAFGGIAERFRRAGDLDRAVQLCRDGLKKFPDHLSARVTLGWALLDQGKYDDARFELEQALKRAPDNLAAIRGLAELHDRAEHTMMLPMDGPGQWPPDADTIDAMQAETKPVEESFDFEIKVQVPQAPEPPPMPVRAVERVAEETVAAPAPEPEPVRAFVAEPAARVVEPDPEPAVAFAPAPELDVVDTAATVAVTPRLPRKKIKAGKRASTRIVRNEEPALPEPAIAVEPASAQAALPAEIVLTNSAGLPLGAPPPGAEVVAPVSAADVAPVEIETPRSAATAAMSAATIQEPHVSLPVVELASLEPPSLAGRAAAEPPAIDLALNRLADDSAGDLGSDLNLDQLVNQLAVAVDGPVADAALDAIDLVSAELPDTSEFDLASFSLEADVVTTAPALEATPVLLDPEAAAEADALAALLAETEALDRQAGASESGSAPLLESMADFDAEPVVTSPIAAALPAFLAEPAPAAPALAPEPVAEFAPEPIAARAVEPVASQPVPLAAEPVVLVPEPVVVAPEPVVLEPVALAAEPVVLEPEPVVVAEAVPEDDPARPLLVLTNPTAEDFPDPLLEVDEAAVTAGLVSGDVPVNDLPLLSAFVAESSEIDAEVLAAALAEAALAGPPLELTNPTIDDFPDPAVDDGEDDELLAALGSPHDFPMLSYLESLPDEPEPVVIVEPKRSPRVPLERFLSKVQAHQRRLMAESVA